MSDEERIPTELFKEANMVLSPGLLNFLVSTTKSPQIGPWAAATSAAFASKLLERALAQHAAALIKSTEASDVHSAALVKLAEASNKSAASLKWATWMLVGATVALVFVTLGLWLRPF